MARKKAEGSSETEEGGKRERRSGKREIQTRKQPEFSNEASRYQAKAD